MPDAGEVKAKVIIEYNGDGIKQAKEDLASLAESAGSVGQSAEKASDGLSGLDGQLSSNAESARGFSNVLADLPKMTEAGGAGVAEMTSALVEQRTAVEEAGTAQEEFGKRVESTASSLEKVAPAMQAASEHTKGLNENISQIQQSFSDLSATIAEPGATEAYTKLWQSVAGESLGASPLGNFEVFQKAYNAIDPSGMYDAAGGMQMINDHLDRTGQSYEQFAGTFSDKNQQLLHEMSMDWSQMGATVEGTGQSFQKTGEKAQSGFSTIASSAGDADQAVAEFLGKTNRSMSSSAESTGQWVETTNGFMAKLGGVMEGPAYSKPVSLGGAFSEVASGVGNMLNEIAMPLMAVQMIGMAVGQVGQAMYDSAAIAEGPASHSFGTFTGTVDALGQSLQNASGQFSEGFGQSLIPTLNALNGQAGGGDLEGLGKFAGGVASTLANLSLITTGVDPWGGVQGLVNQGASMLGMEQPFQGPAPVSQYQRQMNALPQTVQQNAQQLQYQGNLTMAEAIDPTWLAANNQTMASQSAAQYLVGSYDRSHPLSQHQIIQQAQEQRYDAQQQQNYRYQMNNQPSWAQDVGDYWGGFFATANTPPRPLSNPNPNSAAQNYGSQYYGQNATGGGGGGGGIDIGGFFGGMGKSISDFWNQPKGGADTLGMLFSPAAWGFGGQSEPQTFTGGCFVTGTPISLANGTTRSIEALQVGDKVLAYDGIDEVVTTVLARIKPLPKRVYKLTFDNGTTLTLTDSHPLAGVDGWKSLSPEATAQENPGLEVSILAVGDVIRAVDGEVKLTSILPLQGMRQIYNIEVGDPHTFYAAGILVHNKMASSGGSMTNGGVGSEQVSLSHTFTATVQWEANNLQKQFTGAASWVGQGLANTFQGAASWVAQGLSNTFQGAAAWVAQGLSNTFQGAAAWVAQGLQNTFQGAASWIGQGLENTFQGAAKWVGSGLENTFQGAAKWAGSGLEHTFNAVANWTAQNLTPNFSVNPSFTMLADGTSNWGGGPAIVGEAGPEVVEHNGQFSMFNQGAALLNLPQGANVYPMQNLGSSGVTQFADGTSGQVIPLNIGLRGGGMPESISLTIQIGENDILSAVKMPFAQDMRVQSGNRSY